VDEIKKEDEDEIEKEYGNSFNMSNEAFTFLYDFAPPNGTSRTKLVQTQRILATTPAVVKEMINLIFEKKKIS